MPINLSCRELLMKTLPHNGVVVEVGVEHGVFSKSILECNNPKHLYLVDAWSSQPGTDWSKKDPCAKDDHDANYLEVQEKFGDNRNVTIIRSMSVPASDQFVDGSLDIVYIDADHMNAKADIQAYWPKVRPGGYLCGHDYAIHEWITVKKDVDAFVKETKLPLSITQEAWPSWVIQKPGCAVECDTNGIALVVTVYPPYSFLLPDTLSSIEKYWPAHPPIVAAKTNHLSLPKRMRSDIKSTPTEYVVVMHEDFCLCGKVKQDQFDLCLQTMRCDPSIACCSLTWEPSDVGCYNYKKTKYTRDFQVLPIAWDYTINFQMRIWRRQILMDILNVIPPDTTNAELEPLATARFRTIFPGHRAITYSFPDPPNPSTFVDSTDKKHWIIPYNNIIHAGQKIR